MRLEDLAEIEAASGGNPEDVLMAGFGGRPWAIFEKSSGEVIGMFGTHPTSEEDVGAAWMMASPKLPQHRREFLRRCSEVIAMMHEDYPMLTNLVDARNVVHIRWLRWCGFTFIKLHPCIGPLGLPFYEFLRLRDV